MQQAFTVAVLSELSTRQADTLNAPLSWLQAVG
jgi:hypothetical protein